MFITLSINLKKKNEIYFYFISKKEDCATEGKKYVHKNVWWVMAIGHP